MRQFGNNLGGRIWIGIKSLFSEASKYDVSDFVSRSFGVHRSACSMKWKHRCLRIRIWS
jgi:hypothetical protein